ncbi:hypothetical protein, partial [Streptomyces kronopolitis]|uniref:hypothetical protein n=1 Tax=Streptomyces kronopolitis TaxID=1612435 RepID=UPI0020C0B4C6
MLKAEGLLLHDVAGGDIQVQLCTDLERMPVEDTTVEWPAALAVRRRGPSCGGKVETGLPVFNPEGGRGRGRPGSAAIALLAGEVGYLDGLEGF